MEEQFTGLYLLHSIFCEHVNYTKETHKEVSRPSIFLCYAAESTLHVPFPIDSSCAISKVFLI